MRSANVIRRLIVAAAVVACAVIVFSGGSAVQAQTSPSSLSRPKVNWFGPVAISPNDTFQFNYMNQGVDPVLIEWALSNAETGEPVCDNFGKPSRVEPGKGIVWLYSQPIIDGVERPQCYGGRLGHELEEGESYFDANLRHGLLGWTFIQHLTARGEKLAVDLPTLEIFNSMIMPDGSRSMTFGRTLNVIHANPTAPGDAVLKQLKQ